MMKNLLLISLFSIFCFAGCKSDLEKIDINNIEANRAYQDSILTKAFKSGSYDSMLVSLKNLIYEFKNLEKDSIRMNDNYFYYLARLYNNVNTIPIKGFWIDSINNKLVRRTDYSNFYDSAFIYAENSLALNKNNIRSMFILSESFYYEFQRRDRNLSLNMPFSFNKNEISWNKRLNFIINNAVFYNKIDTSKDKVLSRGISEVAIFILDKFLRINNYKFESNNEVLINQYLILNQLLDYVKGKEKIIYDFPDKILFDLVSNNIKLSQNEYNKKVLIEQNEYNKKVLIEQKKANINAYGSQYIGKWKSDAMKSLLTIKNDGSYEIYYYDMSPNTGKGNWDCTSKSISFTKTSGEHVAFYFEEIYHSNTATFEFNNLFAPTLCLNGPDGHVDFCFSHHEK